MGLKDLAEKLFLGKPDVFADVFNGFACNGKPVIAAEDLEDCAPTTGIKPEEFGLLGQERDVVKLWKRGNVRIAMLGIENQTAIDEDMALRILSYDGATYKGQLKARDAAKKQHKPLPPLYPCITLVIYYGKEAWQEIPLSTRVNAHELPESMRAFINDYKVHVLDVLRLSREDVEKFQSDFKHLVMLVQNNYNNTAYEPDPEDVIIHPEELIDTVAAITEDDSVREWLNNISDAQKKGGIKVCNLKENMEAIGANKATEKIIRSLNTQGVPLEVIANSTEFSIERIQEILADPKE